MAPWVIVLASVGLPASSPVSTSTSALVLLAAHDPLAVPLEPAPLAPPASSDERAWLWQPTLSLRVAAGSEWDSNAPRAPTSPGRAAPPGDGVVRVLADLRARLDLTSRDLLTARYVVGMKRFFVEAPEDLFVHDVDVSASVGLPAALDLQLRGRHRASHVRSGARDYTLSSAEGGLSWRPHPALRLSAAGRVDAFDFPPTCELAYVGPAARVAADVSPLETLEVGAHGGWAWRTYEGAFQLDQGTQGVLCRGGAESRRDGEPSLGIHGTYRGGLIAGVELQARFTRSTQLTRSTVDPSAAAEEQFADLDRYRASAFVTAPLPLDLVLSVAGSLQFNRSQTSSPDVPRSLEVEDDENQNSLEVQLSRAIGGGVEVVARYALYANEFATAEADFLRHTAYLGLSFEASTR